jgi:hypothetical protein
VLEKKGTRYIKMGEGETTKETGVRGREMSAKERKSLFYGDGYGM